MLWVKYKKPSCAKPGNNHYNSQRKSELLLFYPANQVFHHNGFNISWLLIFLWKMAHEFLVIGENQTIGNTVMLRIIQGNFLRFTLLNQFDQARPLIGLLFFVPSGFYGLPNAISGYS